VPGVSNTTKPIAARVTNKTAQHVEALARRFNVSTSSVVGALLEKSLAPTDTGTATSSTR
jgi:hypothetical protein